MSIPPLVLLAHRWIRWNHADYDADDVADDDVADDDVADYDVADYDADDDDRNRKTTLMKAAEAVIEKVSTEKALESISAPSHCSNKLLARLMLMIMLML